MNKARETLARYVAYAHDTSENGLTDESPLSVEVNGRYVDILFQTGGPHFDVQLTFDDAAAAEYWFENEPSGGVAHYADWGESAYEGMTRDEASAILAGITRSSEEMGETNE